MLRKWKCSSPDLWIATLGSIDDGVARVLSAASVRAEMLRRGLTPMRCESSKPGRATGYQCGACSNKSKQHDASDTKASISSCCSWQVKRGRKAVLHAVDKFRGVAFANVRRDSCCECLCRAARFCFLMLACQAAKGCQRYPQPPHNFRTRDFEVRLA